MRALASACEQTLLCGTTLSWNNRKCSRKCNAVTCDAEGDREEDEGRKRRRRKPSTVGAWCEIEILGIFNDIMRNSTSPSYFPDNCLIHENLIDLEYYLETYH